MVNRPVQWNGAHLMKYSREKQKKNAQQSKRRRNTTVSVLHYSDNM